MFISDSSAHVSVTIFQTLFNNVLVLHFKKETALFLYIQYIVYYLLCKAGCSLILGNIAYGRRAQWRFPNKAGTEEEAYTVYRPFLNPWTSFIFLQKSFLTLLLQVYINRFNRTLMIYSRARCLSNTFNSSQYYLVRLQFMQNFIDLSVKIWRGRVRRPACYYGIIWSVGVVKWRPMAVLWMDHKQHIGFTTL